MTSHQQQLKIPWTKAELAGKITRLGRFLTTGEIRVLLAIFEELYLLGVQVGQLRTADLLERSRFKRSRYYDHLRLLQARQLVATRALPSSYQGEGVEFWIDWDAIDRLNGDDPPPENRCPTGVRQLSDSCPIDDENRDLSPLREECFNTKTKTHPPSNHPDPDRGTGGTGTAAEREAGWRMVEMDLIQAGVGERRLPIEHGRQLAIDPGEIRGLIAWWREHSDGKWGPGALRRRILDHLPGLDFAAGWLDPQRPPPVSPPRRSHQIARIAPRPTAATRMSPEEGEALLRRYADLDDEELAARLGGGFRGQLLKRHGRDSVIGLPLLKQLANSAETNSAETASAETAGE